jgi:hypothetical protein
MTKLRSQRIRLVFEPNRFAAAQIERVYERLKPMSAHATAEPSSQEHTAARHPTAKRGVR